MLFRSTLLQHLNGQLLIERCETASGIGRFRMLESLRQVGRERLIQAGEFQTVRDRHAYFFLGLSQEAERGMVGAQMVGWLDRLEDESDNLATALDWMTERGEAVHGLQMCNALFPYWAERGHLQQGRDRLKKMLDRKSTRLNSSHIQKSRMPSSA